MMSTTNRNNTGNDSSLVESQACSGTNKSTEELYQELVENAKYWKERWEKHPLNRGDKSMFRHSTEIETWDLKFDHERFVLIMDAIQKYKGRGKLPSNEKPKGPLRTFKVGRAKDVEVAVPYQTYYEGKFSDAKSNLLYCENLNIFNYDRRTHYKFTIGNFEAAFRITRHIWEPRLRVKVKANKNWEDVISPICYSFLSGLQREITGYEEEFFAKFNKVRVYSEEKQLEMWQNDAWFDEPVSAEKKKDIVLQFAAEVETCIEVEETEEIIAEHSPYHYAEVVTEPEKKVEIETVQSFNYLEKVMTENIVPPYIPVEEEIYKEEVKQYQAESWTVEVEIPSQQGVEIVQALRVKEEEPMDVDEEEELLPLVLLNEVMGPDLAKGPPYLEQEYIPPPIPLEEVVERQRQRNLEFPFKWYPKLQIVERKHRNRKPFYKEPVHEIQESFFHDLFEVYIKIGRPDLALKQKSNVRVQWLRKKVDEAHKDLFKRDRVPMRWEAQSGSVPQEVPACVHREKKRDKAVRFLSNQIPFFERHVDKMLVLSHRGPYAYMTRWDTLLFDRQKTAIGNIDVNMVCGYREIYYESNSGITLPITYVEEAQMVLEKIRNAVIRRNDKALYHAYDCLWMFCIRWHNRKFNYLHTACRAGPGWKAQSDNGKTSVGAAPPAKGAADPTAKVEPDKPITSGNKDVTMTHIDERAVQKDTIKDLKKNVKESSVTPELPYSMQDVMRRKMFIDRMTWSTGDENGKMLKQWIIPEVYFNSQSKSPTVCQNLNAAYVLAMFGACSFDMVFKLMANSVKFQLGKLILVFKPFYDETRALDILNNLKQYPYITIDAAESNSGELRVPFTNFRDAFPIYYDTHTEFNYFGTLHLFVWNALKTGTNSSNDVSVSLWCHLENVQNYQLSNPKSPGSVQFASKVMGMPERKRILLIEPRTRIATMQEWEAQAGVMESLLEVGGGLAAEVGAKAVEGILQSVLPSGHLSKPSSVLPPRPTIIEVMPNTAPCEGIEMTNRLSLHPMRVTPPTKESTERHDLKDLMSTWSRIKIWTWNATDEENAVVGKIPATIMLPSVVGSKSIEKLVTYSRVERNPDKVCILATANDHVKLVNRYGTMLDYLARMFYYWRGSISLRFEVVKTPMHSGRLYVRYEAYGTSDTATAECQKAATPGVLWDVQEKNILDIEIPYSSVARLLMTDYVSDGFVSKEQMLSTCMGLVEMTVFTRLKYTAGISQSVPINVYMSGPKIEFYGLNTMEGVHSIRNQIVADSTIATTNKVKELFDLLFEFLIVPLRKHWYATTVIKGPPPDLKIIRKFDKTSDMGPWCKYANIDLFNHARWQANWVRCAKEVSSKFVSNLYIPDFSEISSAYNWLASFQEYWPEAFTGLKSKAQYSKLLWWMAAILLREHGWKLTHFPKIYITIPETSPGDEEREAQSGSGETDCFGAGVNPFNKFLPPKPATSDVFHESYTSIYDIMKRPNMLLSTTTPYINSEDPVDFDRNGKWKNFGMDVATMAGHEIMEWFVEVRIPVSPMTPVHSLGNQGHCYTWGGAVGTQRWVSALDPQLGTHGANMSSQMALTTQRYIGEVFTFWRGSMRYMFTFPQTYNSQGPWSVYVFHDPRLFTQWDCFSNTPRLAHKSRLAALTKLGGKLFNGNVMASFSVEVPYASRYGKLYNNPHLINETTHNGTLIMMVPLIRNSVPICGNPPDDYKMTLEGLFYNLWISVGEDFQYYVPRAAPVQILWQRFYDKKTPIDEDNTGYDSVMLQPGSVEKGEAPSWEVSSVVKEVRDMGGSQSTTANPYHSPISMEIGSWNPEEENIVSGEETENAKYMRKFSWFKERLNPPAATGERVCQAGDGEGTSTDPDVVDGAVLSAVVPNLTAISTGSEEWSADGAMQEISATIVKLNVVFKEIHECLNLAKDTGSAWNAHVQATAESVSQNSNLVGKTAKFALDATRVALFFKGILDAMRAESWSDRWLPIAQCALSLGLSASVVTRAGEWLMGRATALFGSEKVHETEAQAFEDTWNQSWSAFIEEHASIFKLIAAGALTIACFYVTSDAPLHSKVQNFSTSMLHKLRNFAIVGTAIKTLDWLFRWIGDVIKSAFISVADWFSGGMVTAHQMSVHYPEVIAWMKSIEVYKTEALRMQLAWDHDARLELWKKMDEGESLLSKMSSKVGSLYNTIMRGMLTLQNAHDAALQSRTLAPFREDPFHISLVGAPGVGKSSILTFIMNFVCNSLDLPKKHRFYTRGENDDYWTGYTGQSCVLIDDLYADKKGIAIKELIKMKSNLAWPLNMASIEEKGRCFISKLIGSTSNAAYPNPEELSCPEAMWRRRDMLVKVTRVKPLVAGEATKWDDLRFALLDPKTQNSTPLRENMTLEDLLVVAVESAEKWLKFQRSLVFSCMQGQKVFIPDYGTQEVEKQAVDSNLDCLKTVLRTGKVTPTFFPNFVRNLTETECNALLQDKEIMTNKIVNESDFMKVFIQEKQQEILIKKLPEFFTEDRLLGEKMAEFQNTLTVLRPFNVLKEDVVDGVRTITFMVGGQQRPDLGKIVVNETDPAVQQYQWEAQADDGFLDEILNATDAKTDELFDKVHKRRLEAKKCIEQKEQLTEGFEYLVSTVTKPPGGKFVVLASDQELSTFVTGHFPELNVKQRQELRESCKQLFNRVHQSQLGRIISQNEQQHQFSQLFDLKNDKFWKKEDKKWKMVFTEKDYETEDGMALYTLYELMTETWKQEQIDEMKELCVKPPKENVSGMIKVLETFYKKQKDKITNWFKEHPNVVTFLKIGFTCAALFAGYKLLSYVCPSVIDKIKAGWAALFGWGASKIGEERVDRALEYGKRKFTGAKEKTQEWYQWVRTMMLRSEDPELQEASANDEAVRLMAEGLPRMAKNMKNVLVVSGNMPESVVKKIGRPSAYFIGNEQRVMESEKKRLAEMAVKGKDKYKAEGSMDENASRIRMNKLQKNAVRLMWSNHTKTITLTGIFVEGRILLVPYHFFESCLPGQTFVITNNVGCDLYDVFQPERCVKLRDQDLCVYQCGPRVGEYQKITNHFIDVEDIQFKTALATLNTLTPNLMYMVQPVEATLVHDMNYSMDGTAFKNAYAWDYDARTMQGDCGSILLADSPGITRKILGMHVAGAKEKNVGSSAIVFRSDLEQAIAMLPPSKVKYSEYKPTEMIVKSVEHCKVVPQGNFEYLGAVSQAKAVQLPHKTEILPSPIHDRVRLHVTEPAVLLKDDPRNESGESPLVKAISKYGTPTLPFNPYDLDYIEQDLTSDILTWDAPMPARKLTDHEAVFGNEHIEYCDRMNLSASPGYPYTLSKPAGEKGKGYLYDYQDAMGIADESYRSIYCVRELLARNGKRKVSVWTDCLKDERRPLEKIKSGKTRAFVLPPADFVQLFRKYFMAFSVCFYSNHVKTMSAVGIDPYSFTWTRLMRKMRRKSNLGFGGDFHSFDGIFDPDIMYRILKSINAWYAHHKAEDFTEEDQVVREVLFHELIHTVHICLNSVYCKFQGNPSGNPLTVIVNTLAHCYYIRLSWLELARELAPGYSTMHAFHRFVEEMYYGDDGFLAIKFQVSDWFNLETVSGALAKHRIEYTSESKDGVYKVRPLWECTFLKNGFSKLAGTDLWLAPIARDTIYELTNWIRKSDDPILQLRENLDNALKFSFHHGRDFYDRFCKGVNIALKDAGLREIPYSYDVARGAFLSLCRV